MNGCKEKLIGQRIDCLLAHRLAKVIYIFLKNTSICSRIDDFHFQALVIGSVDGRMKGNVEIIKQLICHIQEQCVSKSNARATV